MRAHQVEHGLDDECVPVANLNTFLAEMSEANVDLMMHVHTHTPHGFTLPPTIGPPGKLTTHADRRSSVSLLALLREVWPATPQRFVERNAAGTLIPPPGGRSY